MSDNAFQYVKTSISMKRMHNYPIIMNIHKQLSNHTLQYLKLFVLMRWSHMSCIVLPRTLRNYNPIYIHNDLLNVLTFLLLLYFNTVLVMTVPHRFEEKTSRKLTHLNHLIWEIQNDVVVSFRYGTFFTHYQKVKLISVVKVLRMTSHEDSISKICRLCASKTSEHKYSVTNLWMSEFLTKNYENVLVLPLILDLFMASKMVSHVLLKKITFSHSHILTPSQYLTLTLSC